ncbi:NAD-dependent epimerase/dehydratase family protein [Pontibacter sp. CAU 1760]
MKVIITGTTGMVGEGVLLECLANPAITDVLSVSRKPIHTKHPKLKEYIVADFTTLKEADKNLEGYDACFYCAGVSSVGMKEPEYTRITYDTTMAFAKTLHPKQQMTFAFVSGAGTDSSERGRQMWARVKGKTENALMKMPFKQVFAFRPGLMKFTEGQKNLSKTQKFMSWVYPVFNAVFPKTANTICQLGQAMIYAAQNGYEKKVVEVSDIRILADRATKQ